MMHGEAHDARREPAVAAGELVEAAVEHAEEAAQRPRPPAGRLRARRCGLSSSAHSAGDSVSETISEITVAPAMVSANCR